MSPSVDVRRGWESMWTSIAEDVWETVAAIREANPFAAPPIPGAVLDGTSGSGGLTNEWLAQWNATMAYFAAPGGSGVTPAATPNSANAPATLPTAAAKRPLCMPRIAPNRRLQFLQRTWALLSDHRRARIAPSHESLDSVHDFVAYKLGREIRTMLESTLAVLYDLGYDESEPITPQQATAAGGGGGSSRGAAAAAAASSSSFTSHRRNPHFATPIKTQFRRLLHQGIGGASALSRSFDSSNDHVLASGGSLSSLVDVPEAEREAALGWVLQVLLTLRLHCAILGSMLSHQFKHLEDKFALGPKAVDVIMAKEVRESFQHQGFYTELARAVASLEMPSRLGSRLPGENVMLLAMVPVVNWCFSCGLSEIVTTFAEELKFRWAQAADLMLEEMSPELTPVATARQLLCVIDHCNAMVASLGSAIGDIHAQAVRREIAVAVLCKDTVGLIVRSLFRAALAVGVAPVPPTNASSPVAAGTMPLPAPLIDDDVRSVVDTDDGSMTWQSIGLTTEADGGDLTANADTLHRILAEGVGISDVEDELVAAIAEHLNDVIQVETSDQEHAALALHVADAVASVRRVLHVPLEMNLLPASAKTAGARNRAAVASVKRAVASPTDQVGPLFSHTECCITALSRAAQQVVGSHSAALEESLAHALFDPGAHHVIDARDELVALCDYVQSTDRFVELCKHCVASRYLHITSTSASPLLTTDDGYATLNNKVRNVNAPAVKRAYLTAKDLQDLQSSTTRSSQGTTPVAMRSLDPTSTTAGPKPSVEEAWRRFDQGLEDASPTFASPTAPNAATAAAALHPPQSTILTGSVADSTEYGGGGIVPVIDAHAALLRRLPPSVLSPLTSLLLELRHAYYVDSDTVASPFTQSHNDLTVTAVNNGSGLTGVVNNGSGELGLIAPAPPPRPRFDVLCRCLSMALWQCHVPHVTAVQEASGDGGEQPRISAVLPVQRGNGGPSETSPLTRVVLAPINGAIEWLQRQYALSYPRRNLTWPALTGDLMLSMRLGDLEPANAAPTSPGFKVGGRIHRTSQQQGRGAGVLTIHAVPALSSLLLHFNAKSVWTVADLAACMQPLPLAAVRNALEYIAATSGIVAAVDDQRLSYAVVPLPPGFASVGAQQHGHHSKVGSGGGRAAATSSRMTKIHLLGVGWAAPSRCANEGQGAGGVSSGLVDESGGGGAEDDGVTATSPTLGGAASSSGLLEATLAASRQRTAEAAIVRLLKRADAPLPPSVTFERAAECLRPYFVLDQRLFRRSVEVLLDRDFIRRVEIEDSTVLHLQYVA